MRSPSNDLIRLKHILYACDVLIKSGKTETLENIEGNPVAFYGYVKLVEIIGEATYKLTKEYKSDHPEVPWSMMEGMRHVLVHDYYQISSDKLWNTIQYDIPPLRDTISTLIDNFGA